MPTRILCFAILFSLLSASGARAEALGLDVVALASPPRIDGDGSDWDGIPSRVLALRGGEAPAAQGRAALAIRAAVHDDRLYLWLSWEDRVASRSAGPWRLGEGARREDRLTFKIVAPDEIRPAWMSDWQFTADTWHWRSSARQPHGIVLDKATVVSRHADPATVRPAGGAGAHASGHDWSASGAHGETSAQYDLGDRIDGSLADVQSRASWRDGVWQLELSRRLDTGHADDIALRPGQSYRVRISVSASNEAGQFAVAEPLNLRF